MNWYYAKNGTQQGPLPTEDMKSRIAMEEISPTDLAWCEGMADWMPVGTIAALKVEAPPARVDMLPSPGASRGEASTPAPEPYRPPVATPAPGGASPVMPGQQPSQGLSIASMICGIIGLIACCFWPISGALCLAAIIMGHIASSKIKANPAAFGGRGMARSGLITGYIGLLLTLVFIGFAVWFSTLSPEKMEEFIKNLPEEQQKAIREQMERAEQQRR